MFIAFFLLYIKGASSDFKTATSIAKQMVMYYGMSENVSLQTEQVKIKSVTSLFKNCICTGTCTENLKIILDECFICLWKFRHPCKL